MKINISKQWLESRAHLEEGMEIGAGSPQVNIYDAWFDEVLRIAFLMEWPRATIESIDKDAWKSYFDEGETPAQAWREELEAAL